MTDELRDKMKKYAISTLKNLDVYKPYIDKFKKDGTLTLFINHAGYYVDEEFGMDESEVAIIMKAVKEVEETYSSLVYAVTAEQFEFGLCYTLLTVSPEDLDDENLEGYSKMPFEYQHDDDKPAWCCYAYVYNSDRPEFSEFGTVAIRSAFGGLRRLI